MKIQCLFFLLLVANQSSAQAKYAVFLNAGYTYNDAIELDEVEVKKSQGYVVST